MALLVLGDGFEESVRVKLGVSEGELPNNVINTRLIAEVAEKTIIKRVTDWESITDETELLLLEGAIISYICYQLAPSMARRVNLEVSTMDVKWKKDKINWTELAEIFLSEVELQLLGIESVSTDVGDDGLLVEISRNERVPL